MKAFFALLMLACASGFAAAKYGIDLNIDKADGAYKLGDTVKFTVLLKDDKAPCAGRKMAYSLDYEMGEDKKGEFLSEDKPKELSFTFDAPTRIIISATLLNDDGTAASDDKGRPVSERIGVIAGLESYKPQLQEPADFMDFWKQSIAELDKVPMDVLQMTKIADAKALKRCPYHDLYDIRVRSLGDAPVSGVLAVPKNARKGCHPAMLNVPGAGFFGVSYDNVKAYKNMICLDINAHGIDNGRDAAYHQEMKKKISYSRGIDKKETYYLRFMFLRAIRALEYLKSREEWDGKNLIVQGWSQGGCLTTMASALDPQVTLFMSGITAACDHGRILAGMPGVWPSIITMKDGKPQYPARVETARYFDVCFFARHSHGDAHVAIGLLDNSCCTSAYTGYNCLPGPKCITTYPRLGHSSNCVNPSYAQKINRLIKEVESKK